MTKWEEKRLGEVAPFIYGKALTAEKRKSGKYKVFSSAGVCGFSDNALAKRGIIIGRKGSVGTVFLSESPFYCIDTAFYIDNVDDCCDMKFLFYYMTLLNLESYNNDAAVPGLNRILAHKLKIKIPDLPTQQRIADILSAYDDLIENNNKRIALLEKAAQELYKEWFVRFRFPGHETTRFVNGLPEGWEVKRIKDIATVKSGYAFKSEWWQNDGVPVVKIKDIQNNTIDMSDFSYVSEEIANKAKHFFVTAGDLLIAMTGATIGKIALVPKSDKMTVNQRVGKFFLGKEPIKRVPFLFCLFLQNSIQEQIITIANSNAAQPNISPFDIEKLKIFYNTEIIARFNDVLTPSFQKIINLRAQNQNLAKQRDLLLPRLMSGKLEV
jgi:type I restriction enzyme S subunit